MSEKKGNRQHFLEASTAFFVLSILSMVFGASGIGGISLRTGANLLWMFIALAVASFIAALISEKEPRG
jgi:uncharacterized membrane protein YoaK (UPF0700 family)